jgi:hypothetical protein
MVFGESVMNDAVAIVLSRTVLSFKYVDVNGVNIAKAVLLFLKIFVGSTVIGLIFGVLSAWVMKQVRHVTPRGTLAPSRGWKASAELRGRRTDAEVGASGARVEPLARAHAESHALPLLASCLLRVRRRTCLTTPMRSTRRR